MDLELTDDEATLLRALLDSSLRDLRMEIADTDSASFRRGLKVDEANIRSLLDRVGGPLPNPE